MNLLKYHGWDLEIDAESTRKAFEAYASGGYAACACVGCQNLYALGERAFPDDILDLFRRLGIDFRREAEAYQVYRKAPNAHVYCGWYHFAGRIVSGPLFRVPSDPGASPGSVSSLSYHAIADGFSIGFSGDAQVVPSSFLGLPLVQLEWSANLPWIIALPEPD